MRTVSERFWSKVDVRGPKECWVWQSCTDGHGYGCINIHGSMVKAHRVSWKIANGPIQGSLHVCHKCDNPPCVNPLHLFVGTRSDNMRDAAGKGRNVSQRRPETRQGENNGKHKLTATQVHEIRAAYDAGESVTAISVRYSFVKEITVYQAATRWSWKSLPEAR